MVEEKIFGKQFLDVEIYVGGGGQPGKIHYPTPRYSTNIADAWLVIDRITIDFAISQDGFGLGFRIEHRTENSEDQWLVTLPKVCCSPPYEEMEDEVIVEADTAPLAICLAALKAKGVDVGTL